MPNARYSLHGRTRATLEANAAAVLLELDLDALIGGTVASAREVVERAGGEIRTATPGGAVTADFRVNRVTLVVENDRVIAAHGLA